MQYIDFSRIFHQSSKNKERGHSPISKDSTKWPEEWRAQIFKSYPRFPKIVLPRKERRADFFELIQKRVTNRKYNQKPVSLEDVGSLLEYSCGVTHTTGDGMIHRAQPSGGARFPIEVYVVVFVPSEGLPSGVYHYDVVNHQLSLLWKRSFTNEDIGTFFHDEWIQEASIVIFMTAVFSRMQMKYGERGYRYILIEAGHIGQNISLAAEALGLKSCAIGGSDDDAIERLLDIDGVSESLVYTMVIGKSNAL